MGKARKMGIRAKFLMLVVVIVFLSSALFSISAIREMYHIKDITRVANEKLGTSAAETSGKSLQDLASGSFMSVTYGNTELIDEKLMSWQEHVNILSDYITKIYMNPEEFKAFTPPPIDIANRGVPTLQANYATGVTYESVKDEVLLIANAKHVMDSILASDSNFLTVYFGTESGFILGFDDDSDPYAEVEDFDPRERDWYKLAKERGSAVYAPLSDDYFERGLVVTVAAPFKDGEGNFVGVCAIDIAADNISNAILHTKVGKAGFAFWVDNNSRVVSNQSMLEAIKFKKPEDYAEAEPGFASIITQLMEGKAGYETISLAGDDVFVFYDFLEKTSWGYGIVLPVSEVIESSQVTKDRIDRLTDDVQQELSVTIGDSVMQFVFIFFITALLAMFAGAVFASRLTKPVQQLSEGVQKISKWHIDADKGVVNHVDFDMVINVKSGDEIEGLANAFNNMTEQLNSYINNLAKITAEKERIATELSVATEIQSSMLPCIFPPFPDRKEFDIYATMTPAKEVGGDFFDFFLIDDDTLALVIADVSGKGIPAALFMVIAKTLIKNYATMNKDPSYVFSTVNNVLCENNSAFMFVTAFIGILDLKTYDFTYCNAGHNPPVIKKSGKDYELLNQKPGFVLAAFPDFSYEKEHIQFSKGDIIFLYTDGVTEAMNPSRDIYTEKRMVESLKAYDGLTLPEILQNIKGDLDAFADGEPQADDITMLAIKIH